VKISIVTPNYNYGRFLQTAIDSVFQQWETSHLSIEHIIIDAGSTDESIAILKAHCAKLREKFPSGGGVPEGRGGSIGGVPVADNTDDITIVTADTTYRFRWVSEPDNGQTHAINKGLQQSTGDILCWLNSDETYRDNALQKVAQAFESHPQWDIMYGEIDFLREDGSVLHHKYDHPFAYPVLLCYGCFITSAATFWRRRAYERVGVLDEHYRVTMDYDYWMRMAKQRCRFGFIPETLAGFMYHATNVSVQFDALRRQEVRRVRRLHAARLFGNPVIERMMYPPGLALRLLLKLRRRL